MAKTYKSISEVLKMVKKYYNFGNTYNIIRYELSNHGILEASKDKRFSAKLIKRKSKSDYLKVKYYYNHPSNFFGNEWVETIIYLQ